MTSILDVSSVVHGGHKGSPDYRINGFPVGGLRRILSIINSDFPRSDIILCFDSPKLLKKELLPTYKAGRVPDYSVAAQVDLLKEILMDCNMPFYIQDGYEADDLICSVVHLFGKMRSSEETVIYSDDRDLSCCVSPTVKLQNVTTNGMRVDYESFSKRKLVSTGTIPYNTILLHKMLHGDKSDNYAGLKLPGLRFDSVAFTFTEAMNAMIEQGTFPHSMYMSIEAMEYVIDNLPGSFDDNARALMKMQARIVFPYLVDVTINGEDAMAADLASGNYAPYQVVHNHLKICTRNNIDYSKFCMYCGALGLNRCRTERTSFLMSDEIAEFKNSLKIRAKELSSGVMAVERYRNRTARPSSEECVENMQLPL